MPESPRSARVGIGLTLEHLETAWGPAVRQPHVEVPTGTVFPSSYLFRPDGVQVHVTFLLDRASEICVLGLPREAEIAGKLAKYSGMAGWDRKTLPDPGFSEHFAGFQDQEGKKNSYYVTSGGVALAQRDTPFGELSLVIRSIHHMAELRKFRARNREQNPP